MKSKLDKKRQASKTALGALGVGAIVGFGTVGPISAAVLGFGALYGECDILIMLLVVVLTFYLL